MKGLVKALDELTFGERIPNGLNLVSGASGTGKTIFCEEYSYETLRDGGRVLWITTEELPSSLREGMLRFGWNVEPFEREGRLHFFDAASPARLGFSENVGHGMLGLDPTGMLIVITEQLRLAQSEGGKRDFIVVMDSISRLLLSCEYKAVIDFVACLNSRIENFRAKGFATLSEGAHDEKALNALSFSCTGTIRFRIREVGEVRSRQLRIESLRGRPIDDRWKSYLISGAGLDLEV